MMYVLDNNFNSIFFWVCTIQHGFMDGGHALAGEGVRAFSGCDPFSGTTVLSSCHPPFSTIRVADFSFLDHFGPKPQLNCTNCGVM